MADYERVDFNAGGDYKATPLHYAAFQDRDKCARALVT